MMNYEEFKNEIIENIKEHLSSGHDDVTVTINDVVKNNDRHLDGLMIRDESVNISPTIYLNNFYEEYVDGADMDEILDKIAGIYEANVIDHDFDLSAVTDFEAAKDRIVARVVNAGYNSELLANRPHILMDDLAITYHIDLGHKGDGAMSTAITNALAEQFGVTAEDLHKIALANIDMNNKSVFKGMTEVMMEMVGAEIPVDAMLNNGKEQMYVLSNESKMNGAAAILDTKMMDSIAEKLDGDYYILPSSIHETLVVPMGSEADRETLESMVRDVNATQLAPEEKLSDHVYVYDSQEHTVMRADRYEEIHADMAQEAVADMPRDQYEKAHAGKADKAVRQEKKEERPSLKARLDEKKAEAAKMEKKNPMKNRTKEAYHGR